MAGIGTVCAVLFSAHLSRNQAKQLGHGQKLEFAAEFMATMDEFVQAYKSVSHPLTYRRWMVAEFPHISDQMSSQMKTQYPKVKLMKVMAKKATLLFPDYLCSEIEMVIVEWDKFETRFIIQHIKRQSGEDQPVNTFNDLLDDYGEREKRILGRQTAVESSFKLYFKEFNSAY